jgi:hypothetical protein
MFWERTMVGGEVNFGLVQDKIAATASSFPKKPLTVHSVDFGTLQLKSAEKTETVELKGEINCPFDFIDFTINEPLVAAANIHCVEWLKKNGLISDDPRVISKVMALDFARFADFTHICFDMRNINSIQDVPGKNPLEKLNLIMKNNVVPLPQDKLNDASLWLNFLFPLDDTLEHLQHLELMTAFISGAKDVLDSKETVGITPALRDSLKTGDVSHDTKLEEDFEKLNKYLKALSKIHEEFSAKYPKNELGFIDYSDFTQEVIRYLTGNLDEMQNRLNRRHVDEENFTTKRLFTSAVYTVYMMSILTSGLNIPRTTRLIPQVHEAETNFSHIICRMNAYFSAFRESETPNWLHNDIEIIRKTQEEFNPDISLATPVKMLFRKITNDMNNAENVIATMDADLNQLLYMGTILKWGIGSIPAQLCTPRYYRGKDENGKEIPYVSQKNKADVGSNYWEFLQPQKN